MSIEDYAKRAHVVDLFARLPIALDIAPEIIEALPLAVYACDARGRILWFNARAAELWGRQPRIKDDSERFCGSHRLYLNGQPIPLSECPMAEALRSGLRVRGAEVRIERPDGTSVWATVHIEPVEDETGAVIGAINCFHDSTALRQARNELEDFFESSAVAMHIVSPAGTIVRANKAELDLLGYAADDYVGRNISAFHADDAARDGILKHLQTGTSFHHYPARLRAFDGSIRHVLITSNARVQDGAVINARCVTVDITEQKRAEEALARRVAEQEALFAFTERVQRARTLEDIYGAAITSIMQGLRCPRASILLFDQAKVMRFVAWHGLSESYRRAVDGHSPWTVDTKYPQPVCIGDIAASHLDGALKQTILAEGIKAAAFVPLMENGRLLGKFMVYYETAHEFTEAEINLALTIARQIGFSIERLRALHSAQHLVAIVESSDDAIISKSLDGVIKSWNSGAQRLFGYTPEEVIGKPITILIPPERLDEEPHILARIRRGERVDHYETVRRRKDGSLIDISLTVSPVRDAGGRIVGASKISRDISERKRADRALRESEQRLQDLLAAIPAAIYTTDAAGRITYYNQAAVELAGREPKLGSDEWCVTWKLYHPDGTPLPHDQCPMAIALKEGRAIRNAEAVAERPDGTRIPFIPYPTPLRDADGKITGAINMLVDITERRQAETYQRVLLNELNHRVKNNMQMIQSLLDSAAKQVRDGAARQVFEEATRRISAMASAQRILYSTVSATRFSAHDFVSAVCKTAQETFPKNVTIVCDPCAGELSNDAAMPLALILNELLTNAAKYSAADGRRARVHAGLTREGESFVLYVQDEGPGFDLDAVRKRSSGLRLVEGLAQQLRGQFEVSTNPTRCTVRFS